jgi:hypothetical protein
LPKEAIAMGQNLLALALDKVDCFVKSCRIRFRFLRSKSDPWIVLAIAPFRIATSSGVNRTYAKIRCMSAITKINFAGVYELLNDLLW